MTYSADKLVELCKRFPLAEARDLDETTAVLTTSGLAAPTQSETGLLTRTFFTQP